MKNKSWQHPFPRVGDSYFDKNKDGKLDGTETFFRDMHINEMNARAEEAEKNKTHTTTSYTNYNMVTDKDKKESPEKTTSTVEFSAILIALLMILICFLAVAISFFFESHTIKKIIVVGGFIIDIVIFIIKILRK